MVDRQIPDVWNIFEIASGPYVHKEQEILSKWSDRSSACDRPRTYDKFYQRLPWTYVNSSPTCSSTDLSKEEEDADESNPGKKKSKKKKKDLNYSRTVTERDVKQIERHLSMKKTIRKKIMRDLQQAFVPDPDELAKNNEIKMNDALQFDTKRAPAPEKSDKLLDLLRDSDDSGVVNDDEELEKSRRFKTCRERTSNSIHRLDLISDGECSTDDNVSSTDQASTDLDSKTEKRSWWWEMFMVKKKRIKP
uniref:Putative LOC100644114 [Bombus terrestris] n=1 Tax=Lepeophtheirus salmonis TaxID=72036 RepID=A0A0K2UN60_LEPSM